MKRIILINEDRDFCRIYKEKLEEEGFAVETFYDGKIGLTHILAQRPHLVILGLMLPTLNGFDVLEVLRQKETTKNIPVIVCSKLQGEELEELEDFSVAAFFPKTTCTPEKLAAKVRELLK